jgi:hypothetical protein
VVDDPVQIGEGRVQPLRRRPERGGTAAARRGRLAVLLAVVGVLATVATVETRLRRVYRKLDVEGRAALPAALGAGEDRGEERGFTH